MPDFILYQPFISDAHKKYISEVATPYDARKNIGSHQREYELFQNLYAAHKDGPIKSWGLVSWKFNLKSPVTIEDFYEFASKRFAEGYDGVVINPMIANEALFANVWEQGINVGHQGMDVIVKFLTESTPNILALSDRRSFAFCNYFAGNQNFWSLYFEFLEMRLNLLEKEAHNNTPSGKVYSGNANYGKDQTATMRPFVIERLLSTFLASTPELKVAMFSFSEHHYIEKFGLRLGKILWKLSELKNQSFTTDNQDQKIKWNEARKSILQSYARLIALHSDDAPEIYLELSKINPEQ